MIIICQCRFISCNNSPILVGYVDNGRGYTCLEYGETSVPSTQFTVNLKFSFFKKSVLKDILSIVTHIKVPRIGVFLVLSFEEMYFFYFFKTLLQEKTAFHMSQETKFNKMNQFSLWSQNICLHLYIWGLPRWLIG